MLAKERHLWEDRIAALVRENPTATEDEITWLLVEEMAVKAAALLLPVFEREGGRKGRLSIQTNPKLYRDPKRILEQAVRFASLAPNMQVKAPVDAGRDPGARGDDRRRCVRQRDRVLHRAAGARRRRGRRARAAAARGDGRGRHRVTPVCTIMMGRLDDWLEASRPRGSRSSHQAPSTGPESRASNVRMRSTASADTAPGCSPLPIATICTGRSSSAATSCSRFRTSGRSSSTLPASGRCPRFDNPVPRGDRRGARRALPEFSRAYEPDGLSIDEFDDFGATVRTLRQFIASYQELVASIRDLMLPKPGLSVGAHVGLDHLELVLELGELAPPAIRRTSSCWSISLFA